MANEEAKEAKAKPSERTAFLAEARKRFKRCVDATASNRVFQLDDVKFAAGSPDNGWQWPEAILNSRMKDPNGARPTLTINKLPQHIKLVTNEQRKNKPMGKILPVDDKGDPEVAEILNGIVRHIEVASHADTAYDTACEGQVTSGEGYWRILTEYVDEKSFDQDIRIASVKNPFSVYLDPDNLKRDSTGRLSEYGFVTDRLPTEEYERAFPKAKSKADWDDLQLGDDTFLWFDDDGVMIAEYFYTEFEKTKITLWSDGSVTLGDEMPKVEGLMPADERETELRRVRWCKINGIEVLEEREWAGKYVPIVRVVGNEWDVEGELFSSGIVRNAKDPQRMINYWTSQEAEMLALMPKAPYIGAVGQFETMSDQWRDANITPFSRLEYDPIDVNGTLLPPPQRSQPPMPPIGIIEAKRGSADDLQSVMGQYNPSLGADAKEKSGRAIQARQQQADVGTYHYIDNLSRSIGFSTELILDLIPKIYDTQRVARIIGEDGEPDHCRMCVGQGQAVMEKPDEAGEIQKIYDPSVGKYDVVVSVGASFTTKRLEAAEFLTQTAQAAKDPITAQIITYLALKSQDWPGANEAADMLKKLLPPQVLEDENAKESDPEAMMQKVQQAATQLGQREAQLNQVHEQVAAEAEESHKKMQAATDQEQKAKDAMGRVKAEVEKLNTMQQTLDAERELFAMQQKLAAKEMEIAQTELKAERDVLQAEVKVLQERMASKLSEINAANADLGEQQVDAKETASAMEQVAETMRQIADVVGAERELVYDAQGEPVGSRPVRKAA
jgi:hypothetical protein